MGVLDAYGSALGELLLIQNRKYAALPKGWYPVFVQCWHTNDMAPFFDRVAQVALPPDRPWPLPNRTWFFAKYGRQVQPAPMPSS